MFAWSRVALICLLTSVACTPSQVNVQTRWLRTYAWGAIDGGELDVRDVCASGRAEELSVGSTWATLGISLATLGVYTPREAKVRCVPLR